MVQRDRVRAVYDITHTHTPASNSTVAKPEFGMQPASPRHTWIPSAPMCGSATTPSPEQQGLTILGAPLGSLEYVAEQVEHTTRSDQCLLERIPALDDPQASWLLLLFCARPRCNYILRTTAPELTQEFALRHDTVVAACLQTLLGFSDMPTTSLTTAHLPLSQGSLGSTSGAVPAQPAY